MPARLRERDGALREAGIPACDLVVFDCATPSPRLLRVQDPFDKLLARSRGPSEHTISTKSLIEAAERA